MRITETNCETGETIERDMTEQEVLNQEICLATAASVETQLEIVRLARESAIAKFQAMGLTEDEVKAIVG